MFIQAKKKREELRLPTIHYVVADDWIDKVGAKAFTAWLKFHTWVDRSSYQKENENSKSYRIPMSIQKVATKLGIGKNTLYRSIIIPLWEYGLIDLVEYQISKKSQSPVNIIPYDYPQNKFELATQPLEKCRDWLTDYHSKATYYSRKNGTEHSSKNGTEHSSKNGTGTVPKMEHNNVLNNYNNVSNNLLMDEEKKLTFTELTDYLLLLKIDITVAQEILKEMKKQEIKYFSKTEIEEQVKKMYYEINITEKKIINYSAYFVKGILMQRQQHLYKQTTKQINKNGDRNENKKTVVHAPFYNWLDEGKE